MDQACLNAPPQLAKELLRHTFRQLDRHIAGKPIRHDHVSRARDQLISLDVADEVWLLTLEQTVGLLVQASPFDLLFAHVEQTNARIPMPQHALDVGPAHRRKL